MWFQATAVVYLFFANDEISFIGFLISRYEQVYHSAWRQLCEGVSAAGSLDEVIEVHEAYLLSIQRQCFVVPDKLVSSFHHSLCFCNLLVRLLYFFSVGDPW